ncbi:MAG: transcription termination factor Rho [bacterium]|nr:transcription termination factor Rho [bacterium]
MDNGQQDTSLVDKLSAEKPPVITMPMVTKITKGVVTAPVSRVARMPLNKKMDEDRRTQPMRGVLDIVRENLGVARVRYSEDENDVYIPANLIRKYKLRAGDVIEGVAREPKENDHYWGLVNIEKVNDLPLDEFLRQDRVKFHTLTPVYPDEQIKLESGSEPLSTRIVDLIAPIGKGQRSLIVSPPKAGKTTFLKEISTGVAANYPDIHLMAVLIGERPEEVTDLRRHIEKITQGRGEVAASNFDEAADVQCRVAELALERAKRLVERGRDVVILLDSITRLARAYNLSIPTSGRTLSGGFDPAALFPPKRFFGAARNFERAGSLTIIGTALVDTGSRMDDLVYEEFKGTGNQEVHLDRRLAERRIYPAIEIQKSGTRRDDLLIDSMTYQSVLTLQRMLDTLDKDERTITLLDQMKKTKNNKEFLQSLRK